MHTQFYFAYGSNMNPERVAARGVRFDAVVGAVLDGVRLTFDKQSSQHPGSGHASLTFDRHGRTEGVLYRLWSCDEIAAMDPYETTPVNYSRDVVAVTADGATVVAWTYFANAAVLRRGLRPTRAYLAHLLAGRPYLTPEYAEALGRTPCVDD